MDGFIDDRWCQKCLSEFQHLNTVREYVEKIHSNKVSWGHCEEAAARLKKLTEIRVPLKEEKFCDEPRCKRQRVD